MRILILALGLFLAVATSCEKASGCGEVLSWKYQNGFCYLKVDFGDEVRWVHVDEATWYEFNIGDYVCF